MTHPEARWRHPLVRVEQSSTINPTSWDAWDADGRHYALRYESNYGSVQLDDERVIDAFYRPGVYTAVIGLDEFLALAGLRYESEGTVDD